ncbi:MAG: putative structural protein [Prokaryotic dsDNA virus sp.]|nr:MAG: putative structural protein [Prokaryotic dsDNA virus sp.]|tara:strand:+ start:27105 stop:28523 length:1419 start_codon:yes stop_codon:yes gene_type:complete
MAFGVSNPTAFSPTGFSQGTPPALYKDLAAYINEVDKPDIISQLAYIYGDEDIAGSVNGLLELMGASNRDGQADKVEWFEKTRRHFSDVPTSNTGIAAVPANEEDPITITLADHRYFKQDQVLVYPAGTAGEVKPIRATVTSVPSSSTFVVIPNGVWTATIAADSITMVTKFGNDNPQGTDQPTKGILPNVDKHEQSYFILKTMFPASGSQLTNVSWVTDPATGKDCWVYHGENENRKRTMDYSEMMMILGEQITNGAAKDASMNMNGTEGLFTAIENRGINVTGYINDLSEVDSVVLALDRQAGAGEYAFYYDTTQRLKLDNLLSKAGATTNLSSGVAEQYGAFDNDKDMAIKLGFQSFSRGAYTFHGHAWKLLNDPTLLAAAGAGTSYYKYAMIPLKNTLDAKSGESFPILQMNSKSYGGYSRDMEHWMTGAANGTYNDSAGFDGLKWNYRCEKNLVVRGANNLVLGSGV